MLLPGYYQEFNIDTSGKDITITGASSNYADTILDGMNQSPIFFANSPNSNFTINHVSVLNANSTLNWYYSAISVSGM